MKKEWITPQATVDQFATNEYLNMCSEIACDRPGLYHGEVHSNSGCKNTKHQVLKDIDNDGHFDKLYEVKNGTEIPCTLYDENYKNKLTEEEIKNLANGSHIYWTTKYGAITYHHHSTINVLDTSHPNRS